MEGKKAGGRFDLWPLAAKTAVILVLVGVFLELMVPDFSEINAGVKAELAKFKEKVRKSLEDERFKIYSLSFVQNPAALYKTSEIAERKGNIASAIRDMELAIGLLEMHNADKQVIKRYYERLSMLKASAKPAK